MTKKQFQIIKLLIVAFLAVTVSLAVNYNISFIPPIAIIISAVLIRESFKHNPTITTNLSFLHLIMQTPDMGPIMRPYSNELDSLAAIIENHKEELFSQIPNPWDDLIAFQESLGEFKTALILKSWIEEESEESIVDRFRIQPGDLFRIIENAKWLLHSTAELSRLFGLKKRQSLASELIGSFC